MNRTTRTPWRRPALFLLAATLAAPRVADAQATPAHETFTLHSAALGELRTINVYTPPGYDPAGADRYPVLYMPDGGVEEDFPHVSATIDAGIRAGEMRPLILVGIENTERRRDMTGPTTFAEDSAIAPRVGGSAHFRRFFAEELIPEVERRYRAGELNAILGESLAGLFILETFFLQPELFDVYVALDASLWWNGEELVDRAAERLAARPGLRATLYFASAEVPEMIAASERLAETLRAHAPAELRWRYAPRPDLTHATIYRAAAPGILRSIFPPL